MDLKVGERVYVKRWGKSMPDGDGWETAEIKELLPDFVRVQFRSGHTMLVEARHVVQMGQS